MSTLPTRYLSQFIKEDLKKKMVFIGGPRQVGKTTFAQNLLKKYNDNHPGYLNWDRDDHRVIIRKKSWPSKEPLIIFDEIHKFKNWRSFIKGIFDTLKNTHSFLITGSARLDLLRKGGDSLLGRYHYYRMHPYSLPELGYSEIHLKSLFQFGGFPEPLIDQSERTIKRWHIQRVDRLVRIDLRDFSYIKDIEKIHQLAEELPNRVGSPLSIKNLSVDLEVDHKTAKNWVLTLENLYYCFLISPYGEPKIRAVKKEQKLYMWDWSQVEGPGLRFENMMASHLLKYCHFHEDVYGERMELRFIRDTDKREVDFVVLKNKKPIFAVECKLKNENLSSHINYVKERTKIPMFYQVHLEGNSRNISDQIKILNFSEFCKEVKLV
jgi:predicted AAA+ superfamily ATPase